MGKDGSKLYTSERNVRDLNASGFLCLELLKSAGKVRVFPIKAAYVHKDWKNASTTTLHFKGAMGLEEGS